VLSFIRGKPPGERVSDSLNTVLSPPFRRPFAASVFDADDRHEFVVDVFVDDREPWPWAEDEPVAIPHSVERGAGVRELSEVGDATHHPTA
jgi:hypothetical protein